MAEEGFEPETRGTNRPGNRLLFWRNFREGAVSKRDVYILLLLPYRITVAIHQGLRDFLLSPNLCIPMICVKINQCHFGDLRGFFMGHSEYVLTFGAGQKNNQCHGTWDWLEWRPC